MFWSLWPGLVVHDAVSELQSSSLQSHLLLMCSKRSSAATPSSATATSLSLWNTGFLASIPWLISDCEITSVFEQYQNCVMWSSQLFCIVFSLLMSTTYWLYTVCEFTESFSALVLPCTRAFSLPPFKSCWIRERNTIREINTKWIPLVLFPLFQ